VRLAVGQLQHLECHPPSGVEASEESIRVWFEAGVACVGMGSGLIRQDLVAARDFATTSEEIASVLAWIRAACDGASR
jgi:2-dehydro-3-deoxyphosphogluconate aldolase/(4S)-4-hydroxy-2-oxoglutarate aldolase